MNDLTEEGVTITHDTINSSISFKLKFGNICSCSCSAIPNRGLVLLYHILLPPSLLSLPSLHDFLLGSPLSFFFLGVLINALILAPKLMAQRKVEPSAL